MTTGPDESWQASDIFGVIRRLIDDSPVMSDGEKTMAHALTDAHASQYVANTQLFDRKLAVHGGLLGLPPGSPQEKRALSPRVETPGDPDERTATAAGAE